MSRKALKITAGVTATAFTLLVAASCAAQNDEQFMAEREAQQVQEQQQEAAEAEQAEAEQAEAEAKKQATKQADADRQAKAKESAAAQQSAEAKAKADAAKAEQERQAKVDANIKAREAAIQAEADAADAAALAAATTLCEDGGQDIEQIMQPLLLNQRLTFDNTQIIIDGADIWVGASLARPDGTLDTRSDVWVYLEETGMVHAVSMGARGNSLAPDAPFGFGMANANAKTVDQCVVDVTTSN